MKTVFIEEITNHSFTLKCIPISGPTQEIEDVEISLTPEIPLSIGEDAFGNQQLYGKIADPHELFTVRIQGSVTVKGYPYMEPAGPSQWIYKYPTKYTEAGPRLKSLYGAVKAEIKQIKDPMEAARRVMNYVAANMQYQPAVTNIGTTAEQALTLQKGVCQDYAHILIAICRQAHIPARYVVGMMTGEGASHAWVEIYVQGCWYGLDPTNQKMVDDSYIKISHGRDYQDCLVERGIFRGNPNQQKIVGVKVWQQE